jgi:subfamily B ATP-binding cassette protein MsbA
MSNTTKPKSYQLLLQIAKKYCPPYYKGFIVAIILMILVAGSTAYGIYLLKPILNGVFNPEKTGDLSSLAVLLLLTITVQAICTYANKVVLGTVGNKIIRSIQLDFFNKIMLQDMRFFQQNPPATLMSRFGGDLMVFRGMLTKTLIALVKESLTIIFVLAILLYEDWQSTLIIAIGLPLMVYPITKFGNKIKKVSKNISIASASLNNKLAQSLYGIEHVQAYTSEQKELEKNKSVIKQVLKLQNRYVRLRAAPAPLVEWIGGVMVCMVIYFIGNANFDDIATSSSLAIYVIAIMRLRDPMKRLANLNNLLAKGKASAMRVFEVFNSFSDIKDGSKNLAITRKISHIKFENVCFGYHEHDQVLTNLNLMVTSGQWVGIVGGSGTGKSTIAKLLLRFYDTNSGSIKLDDTDIRDFKMKDLRQYIGIVSQNTYLFSDTIRQNLIYGNLTKRTDDEIWQVLTQVGMQGFVRSLPKGLDCVLDLEGGTLSGGQKQRLSIARLMLRGANILIFDEATSALDNKLEDSIVTIVEQLRQQGKTILYITHRTQCLQYADNIINL